jgi:hypothetical protein
MKSIYRLLIGVIVLFITTTGTFAQSIMQFQPFPQGTTYVLYPPTNLTIIPIDCAVILQWDKPHNTGGATPLGLIGYRIYCNGTLIHYLSDPDSLTYYDYTDAYGTYTDSVTAWYDLTVYGYPGQFGESIGVSSDYILDCSATMPFSEPWDQDSFMYQLWSFVPSQGNWMLSTNVGNPLPTAAFTGTPVLTNYDYTLQSLPMGCTEYTCANLYLEFDSRVVVNNPTSQEKLITEIFFNNNWVPKDTMVNNGTTGWMHHKIDISEADGKEPRIEFRAKGIYSADIVEWDVDNIRVYGVCYKPPDFALIRSGNIVHLSWGIPCTEKQLKPDKVDSSILIGYNVYRTNADGLPPYVKLTQHPLTVTSYNDTLSLTSGTYCYYTTALYEDSYEPWAVLCESPGDTLCVHYISGIHEQNETKLRIYPNPVSDLLNIESGISFNRIEILNLVGEKIYSETFPLTNKFTVPFNSYNTGIYLLKLTLKDRTIVMKIQKNDK